MERSAPSRRFTIAFRVGLLCLVGLVLLPLAGSLLGIGWYATARLEEKALAARIHALESSIGTLLEQGFRTIAYTQQTLADSNVYARPDAVLPQQDAAGTRALANMLDRHPNVVAAYVGFGDGAFLYVARVDRLAAARRQEIQAPDKALLAVRTIADHQGERADAWYFTDATGRELARRTSPHTDYDPRSRVWFTRAVAERTSILTEPYAFHGGGGTGITLATATPDGAAVIGADIRVDTLSRALQAFSITPSSAVLVATAAGEELVRAGELPEAAPTDSGSQPGELAGWMTSEIRLAADRGAAASVTTRTIAATSVRLHVKALPAMGGHRPYLAIAAPVSELTAETGALIRRSMAVAVVAVLLALAGAALASRLLSHPLARIARKTDHFRHLDFSSGDPVDSRVREIRSLDNAVEQMRGGLEQFGRYVPRQLVRRVVESPAGAEVGGVRQPVTVLFTDIERFSQMAEAMDPEQLMSRLSKYLESLGSVVTKAGGTIDKYIGDAIMAIWNAPEPDADHVANACRAALAASRTSERLEAKWEQRGRAIFRTRCGLHTGLAVVGNVGSLDRLNYTVVGAVPNVASRLESLNKVYGTRILASGAVYQAACRHFVWRGIDTVVPAGTTTTLDLYELMDEAPDGAGQKDGHAPFLDAWNHALATYRRGEMAGAAAAFGALVAAYPQDGPSRIFEARCRSYCEDGLPRDWRAVTIFQEK